MNILLWILQVLLALHTAAGAVWKFSHTAEQTMPALKAIPDPVWQVMTFAELFCTVALIVPWINKSLSILVPIAALTIAAEMLAFCGLYMIAGETSPGPMIYWLVVAALCLFIAYGRFVLKPFQKP